ncbi:type II toxin-antitoxin system HicB family antitoxin [bacterium]|nr:type II toxin-antitoxin system HicB family antitoxin [bacterium]
MSTISVRIPESLHKKIKELAEKDNISMNQYIASAVAEKVATYATEEYLEDRARRGTRSKFRKALKKVRNVRPDERDQL